MIYENGKTAVDAGLYCENHQCCNIYPVPVINTVPILETTVRTSFVISSTSISICTRIHSSFGFQVGFSISTNQPAPCFVVQGTIRLILYPGLGFFNIENFIGRRIIKQKLWVRENSSRQLLSIGNFLRNMGQQLFYKVLTG